MQLFEGLGPIKCEVSQQKPIFSLTIIHHQLETLLVVGALDILDPSVLAIEGDRESGRVGEAGINAIYLVDGLDEDKDGREGGTNLDTISLHLVVQFFLTGSDIYGDGVDHRHTIPIIDPSEVYFKDGEIIRVTVHYVGPVFGARLEPDLIERVPLIVDCKPPQVQLALLHNIQCTIFNDVRSGFVELKDCADQRGLPFHTADNFDRIFDDPNIALSIFVRYFDCISRNEVLCRFYLL